MFYHKRGVAERARVSAHVWWFLLESKTRTFHAGQMSRYRAL
jgi:hypothetical protein